MKYVDGRRDLADPSVARATSRAAKRARRRRAVLIVPLFLAACAHFPLNAPLDHYDPSYGYRVAATSGDTDDSRELLLVITFSAADCADVAGHLIEVSFDPHPDPAERAYLSSLPTTLDLPEDDVDRIVAAAQTILAASPEFQALLADLAGLP